MGTLNAAPTFVAMMMKLQMEWDKLDEEIRLKVFASKINVDDMLLERPSHDHWDLWIIHPFLALI